MPVIGMGAPEPIGRVAPRQPTPAGTYRSGREPLGTVQR